MLNSQPFVRVVHALCPKHAEHFVQVSNLEVELGTLGSGNDTAFEKEAFNVLSGSRWQRVSSWLATAHEGPYIPVHVRPFIFIRLSARYSSEAYVKLL